ncbi:hypothetical protein C6Q17_08425 [Burkholderia contaminans]|nr:hypothetical protein C6Q17_08425 [Burkholderia contaminans]
MVISFYTGPIPWLFDHFADLNRKHKVFEIRITYAVAAMECDMTIVFFYQHPSISNPCMNNVIIFPNIPNFKGGLSALTNPDIHRNMIGAMIQPYEKIRQNLIINLNIAI